MKTKKIPITKLIQNLETMLKVSSPSRATAKGQSESLARRSVARGGCWGLKFQEALDSLRPDQRLFLKDNVFYVERVDEDKNPMPWTRRKIEISDYKDGHLIDQN